MPRKVGRPKKRKAVRRRVMRGAGFFGDLWSGVKRAVTKPSTWLGAASMLPGPLSIPFKVGSVVSGLTGHGRRRAVRRRRVVRSGRTVRRR